MKLFLNPRKAALAALTVLLTTLGAGCIPSGPLKGGSLVTSDATTTVKQSENPEEATSHEMQKTTVTQFLPPPGQPLSLINGQIHFPEGTLATQTTESHSETTFGKAQKDISRQIAATAKSMGPLLAAGIALMIAGGVLIWKTWYTPGLISIGLGLVTILLYGVIPAYGGMIAIGMLVLGGIAIAVLFYMWHMGNTHDYRQDQSRKRAGSIRDQDTDRK